MKLCFTCIGILLLAHAGQAQLRVSRQNPRYFVSATDTTRAIFLAGSHTWLNNRDGGEAVDIPHVPLFNWQGYLDFLSTNHHTLIKFWEWETDWNNTLGSAADFRYGPYSIHKRTGPGLAEDGFPKFNLDSLDQRYFDRVKWKIDTLAGRGVYAVVMLFNGWAVEQKSGGTNPFRGCPYNIANNTQSVGFTDGNGANTQRLPAQGGDATILSYQVKYVKKLIDELNSRDNVLWEICNEPNSNAQDWQYAIIDTIRNYELRKPKQHPITMSTEYPGANNAEVLNGSRHNTSASPTTDYSGAVNNDTVKVIVSDTDHICGECLDGPWVYKSFCNGVGSILYMDPWDGKDYPYIASNYDSSAASWVSARKAMGQMVILASTLNLIDMRPTPGRASTNYCLSGNKKWVVYQPGSGSFTVNLSSTSDSLNVRWVNVTTGAIQTTSKIVGGSSSQSFTPPPPSGNHRVLYVYPDNVILAAPDQRPALPSHSVLFQNYPNPFNPTTTIQFTIVGPPLTHEPQNGGQGQLTIVTVYDVLGREVATLMNEVKEPGSYSVQFDARLPGRQGSNLASGVYIYRLQTRDHTDMRKLVLMK